MAIPPVLKTGALFGLVGSSPTLSAILRFLLLRRYYLAFIEFVSLAKMGWVQTQPNKVSNLLKEQNSLRLTEH